MNNILNAAAGEGGSIALLRDELDTAHTSSVVLVEKDGAYVKTLPVPVPEMHAFLSSLEADGTPVFAAAVPEEEAYA